MSRRVVVAVTHLLGSGHLVRAGHLAASLAGAGLTVTLASGGVPPRVRPGGKASFLQLPPVKVEGTDFRTLLDEEGRPATQARLAERRRMLVELAEGLRPDLVVTEHFPFGRRQLTEEFLALIAAARAANPGARILSSVRDVLVTPRPARIAEAQDHLAQRFDGVLVHGDPAFLPLEASWPVTPELAAKLHYTGYLEASRPELDGNGAKAEGGDGEILVSGGGSGAALPLFRLCLEAARLLGASRGWRLLVGRGMGEADFAGLCEAAPGHAIVEWARPDFPALLSRCALSISQAGYNTVLDLVAAGRPALVVPFDAGGETEQGIRAEAMARAGLARCLRLAGEEPLTGPLLADAVAAALLDVAPQPVRIDRGGFAAVPGIVAGLLAERAGP